jgi:hypothetical protein
MWSGPFSGSFCTRFAVQPAEIFRQLRDNRSKAFANWSCGDCSRRRIMFLLGAINASSPDRAQAQQGAFRSCASAEQNQRNREQLAVEQNQLR